MRAALARQLSLQSQLQRDGAIWPLQALSSSEATELKSRLLLEMSRLESGETFKSSDLTYYKAHLVFSTVDTLARHPAVVQAAQEALGTDDLLLWDSSIPIKPPANPGAVGQHFPWHQDGTYWGLEPMDGAVSCWVALSDASREHGCMKVVIQSHTSGQRPHALIPEEPGSMLRRGQQVPQVDEGEEEIMALSAGEMSMHHPLALHCSGTNKTSEARVGVVLVFVAPNTRPHDGFGSATLVAGQCDAEHWKLSSWRPSPDAGAEATIDEGSLEAHAHAMETHRGELQAKQAIA